LLRAAFGEAYLLSRKKEDIFSLGSKGWNQQGIRRAGRKQVVIERS